MMFSYLHIGFGMLLLLSACKDIAEKQKVEEISIHEIILLRTEGLLVAEKIAKYSEKQDLRQIGNRIVAYYQSTHPEFVQVCKGKTIQLTAADFDSLYNKVDTFLSKSPNQEVAFLNLYQENIKKSIALYETIIKQTRSEDVSYFSFIALPDLYNQSTELSTLESQYSKNVEVINPIQGDSSKMIFSSR